MATALRTLSRGLLAAVIAATALLVGGVTPAHAYTCGYNDLDVVVYDPEVKVSFRFEEECTDGLARITGTVTDSRCDGRRAEAEFNVYDTTGGNHWLWGKKAIAGNGCGSSSTFTFSGRTPGQYGWRVQLETVACSAIVNCSTTHFHYYYG